MSVAHNGVCDTAFGAARVGLCVMPTREDGSKAPDAPLMSREQLVPLVGVELADAILQGADARKVWKHLQYVHPTADDLENWFRKRQRDGLALVCGAISGNLEMFEVENPETYQGWANLPSASRTDTSKRRRVADSTCPTTALRLAAIRRSLGVRSAWTSAVGRRSSH